VQAQRGHGMQLSLGRMPVGFLMRAHHFQHNGPALFFSTEDEAWVVAEPWPCAINAPQVAWRACCKYAHLLLAPSIVCFCVAAHNQQQL
jgi:hypothetical protein